MKCPYCGNEEYYKVTPRLRAGGVKVKRFQCKGCGRYYQEDYISKKAEPKRDIWGIRTFTGTYITVNI